LEWLSKTLKSNTALKAFKKFHSLNLYPIIYKISIKKYSFKKRIRQYIKNLLKHLKKKLWLSIFNSNDTIMRAAEQQQQQTKKNLDLF